ncbi:MAG: hypothetical protein R2771_01720 [Saprospiraceae bacterium]
MQSNSAETSLLEKGKKIASEIVEAYPENSNFQIITNDLLGEQMRWVDKKNALEKISNISLSPVLPGIKNISNRQIQSFNNNDTKNRYSFWISDFQAKAYDLDTIPTDSTIQYNIVILKSVNENNISIDSCYWDKPLIINNYVNKLLVKITNYGDESVDDFPLNLVYNGENIPMGKFSIMPNSSILDTLDIRIKKQGWNEAKLSIKDYPVIFDDEYYFTFNVPEKVSVLDINDKNLPDFYLKSVYSENDFFDFQHSNFNNVDYLGLSKYQLIILEDISNISSGLSGALKSAMEKGTNVVLFPSSKADIGSLNQFLSEINANTLKEAQNKDLEAVSINENEFVMQNVFDKIPSNMQALAVKMYYDISNESRKNSYNIIKFKNGNSFLNRYSVGSGNFYLFSSPLDEEFNNLVKSPDIFVPLFFKLAISNVNSEHLAYFIGDDKTIKIPKFDIAGDDYLKLSGNGLEIIPKQQKLQSELLLGFDNEINTAGIYSLVFKDSLISKLAFNYSRDESEMKFLDEEMIKEKLDNNVKIYNNKNINYNFTKMINAEQNGIQLWKWAIILALIFLAIEILLIRFWKF